MAEVASEFDSRNSGNRVSSCVPGAAVTTLGVLGSALAGYCWNLEIATAAVAANTMARAVSLRLCMTGLFGGLVAAESAVEAVILIVDCLKGFERGRWWFEMIMFELGKLKSGFCG